jgi:SRSO17 transposase
MKHTQDTIPEAEKTTVDQVARWAFALKALHARIAPRFARSEPRRRALLYLQGLLSATERKNGWQLAEHAREARPYGMQRLLARAVWDADLVRDDLRDYALEHLQAPHGILVIDESGIPKQGEKSAGVQKQYCGSTGEVENCQVGVYLAYVSEKGHALIDRELYLPQSWTDDRERCQEAGIPETVDFQTKCELARQMVERIWRLQIGIAWVVADTVYGNNEVLRNWLEACGYWYVLAVDCNEPVNLPTDAGLKRMQVRQVETQVLKKQDWQRLSMGDGTKGPRLYDWARLPILHQGVDDGRHWLLIRRPLQMKKPKKRSSETKKSKKRSSKTEKPKRTTYYLVFAPPGTTLAEMVKALGARWKIEEIFEAAKGIGMDQYEVRCWTGWYRHQTLVMLAHAFLTVVCAKEQAATRASVTLPSVQIVGPSEEDATLTPQEKQPDSFSSSGISLIPPGVGVRLPSFSPKPALSLPQTHLHLAPLTVPEVCHLLGRLIWPLACQAPLVVDWSNWRREHRHIARDCHTKRRKKAVEDLEAAARASP